MKQAKIGDTVLYGSNGVCEISEVMSRDSGDFFVLVPLHKNRMKLFVPVDNEELVGRMKPVPSTETVKETIVKAYSEDTQWIENRDERKNTAKEVMASGDLFDLLMLVRSFHEHKLQAEAAGKKSTATDIGLLKEARTQLDDEVSAVFQIELEEVESFIRNLTGDTRPA